MPEFNRFGLIIVGSELLTGKRQDGHLAFAIAAFAKRGLELCQVSYLGDEPQRLRGSLSHSMAGRYPNLRLSCLPHMRDDYRETELGVRGDTQSIAGAMSWLQEQLDRLGFHWLEGGR